MSYRSQRVIVSWLAAIAAALVLSLVSGQAQAQWRASDYERVTLESFRQDASLQAPIDFEAVDVARLEAAIFFVTNEARVSEGLKAVAHHPTLELAAEIHARRMVAEGFFGHENPHDDELRTPDRRALQLGVVNPHVAENLATGSGLQVRSGDPVYALDPARALFSRQRGGAPIPAHTYLSLAEAVVGQWLRSAEHRAVLLSPDAVQLGCGAALYREQGFPRFRVVQVFQWFEPAETI